MYIDFIVLKGRVVNEQQIVHWIWATYIENKFYSSLRYKGYRWFWKQDSMLSFSSSSGEMLEGQSVTQLQMNGQLVAVRDR
jgi:hypothetical protein